MSSIDIYRVVIGQPQPGWYHGELPLTEVNLPVGSPGLALPFLL